VRRGGEGGDGSSGDVPVCLVAVSLMGLLEPLDPSADLSQLVSECPERGDGLCSAGGSWRSLILDSRTSCVFLKLC